MPAETKISVLQSASVGRFSVSCMRDFFFCHIKEYSFLCHGNFREYAMIHNDFLYKIHVCKLMVAPFILLDRTNNILLGSFLSACFSSCCQLVLLLDFRTKGELLSSSVELVNFGVCSEGCAKHVTQTDRQHTDRQGVLSRILLTTKVHTTEYCRFVNSGGNGNMISRRISRGKVTTGLWST